MYLIVIYVITAVLDCNFTFLLNTRFNIVLLYNMYIIDFAGI